MNTTMGFMIQTIGGTITIHSFMIPAFITVYILRGVIHTGIRGIIQDIDLTGQDITTQDGAGTILFGMIHIIVTPIIRGIILDIGIHTGVGIGLFTRKIRTKGRNEIGIAEGLT